MIFARSLAGHDAGRLYYVIEETATRVVLSDGKIRKLENPKRKSIKHVQPVCKLSPEIEKERADIRTLTDEKIAHLIKSYERGQGRKEEI